MPAKTIVDIVFFLIILAFMIFGSLRGFSRSLKWGVFLPIILLAILLSSWLLPTMKTSRMGFSIRNSIEKSISKKNKPIMDIEMFKEKNSGRVMLNLPDSLKHGSINPIALESYDNPKVKAGVDKFMPIANKHLDENPVAIKRIFATEIMLHVMNVILHLFFLIILTLAFIGIRLGTKNWHNSDVVAEAVLDRVLGLIMSTVLVFIFMLFILSMIRLFADKSDFAFVNAVKESAVVGKLYISNPVGKVFDKPSFGVLSLLRKLLEQAPASSRVMFLL